MSSAPADAETVSQVRSVALALLPTSPELGIELAAHISARMPEFGRGEVGALVTATCQANANALLDGLARTVPMTAVAPTAEVRQLTRALVRHGLELPSVMRAYRLGAHRWTEHWAEQVRRRVGTGQDAVAVAQTGTRFMFGWLDEVSERLAEEYREEADRLARERSLAHLDDVRRALTESGLDVPATSARLGYNLSGRHVALVLRQEPGGVHAGADARYLAAALGTGRPLIIRVDVQNTWCWVPGPPRVPSDPPRPVPSLTAAIGRPGQGLGGFRASHREALEALRVADLARLGPGSLTCYDDVAVAAVCSADTGWCGRFVRAELGALAADDEATKRVRLTLAAFFAANSNFRATAARLGVHHNTVRYRLDQAERLLGRPPGERRLALELALHLASRLGPWTLDGQAPSHRFRPEG